MARRPLCVASQHSSCALQSKPSQISTRMHTSLVRPGAATISRVRAPSKNGGRCTISNSMGGLRRETSRPTAPNNSFKPNPLRGSA